MAALDTKDRLTPSSNTPVWSRRREATVISRYRLQKFTTLYLLAYSFNDI
ncbi:MAG: hypothetical protein R3240_13920 [Gammaproteobacteria bacterium]|nr:hypothetical protein [Gammaproteobacteria bacterium]